MLSGDLKSSAEVLCRLLEETIQPVAVDVGQLSRAAGGDCSDNGFWLFQRGWCWSAHATELGGLGFLTWSYIDSFGASSQKSIGKKKAV